MNSSLHTLIDIIRHGQPEGGRIYRGNSVDDPLSEKGWAQMWAAVAGACPWQVIVSSPMQRCRAFAEALAERQQLPVEFDARLREVGFGAWEGLSREHVKTVLAREYATFYADPEQNRPAGAEPLAEFMARVAEALRAIEQQYAGKHILVVAHAGVIRAALAYALALPAAALYRIDVGNAGITRLRANSGDSHSRSLQLVFHNCPGIPGG